MTTRRLLFLALILAFAAPVRFARAEDAPVPKEGVKPAAEPLKKKPARKKAAKKDYDYERSKYKAREPSQTPTYKFNEKGEPIRSEAKKNASVKKKKRSEPPEAEAKEGAEACGSAESCAEKKTEADAL